jgi:homoserine kinase
LLGGFVVTCTTSEKVIAIKRKWPPELKIVVVSPAVQLETKLARLALPRLVSHADAVHNLQRTALFNAALSENRPDLFWEAMKDRLHQGKRQTLVPGLAEALSLPKTPGLLGLALSGGGPSVLAVADDHFEALGDRIAECFRKRGVPAAVRQLDVDNEGCHTRILRQEGIPAAS